MLIYFKLTLESVLTKCHMLTWKLVCFNGATSINFGSGQSPVGFIYTG